MFASYKKFSYNLTAATSGKNLFFVEVMEGPHGGKVLFRSLTPFSKGVAKVWAETSINDHAKNAKPRA